MQSYRELKIWQRSFALVNVLYPLTEQFPKSQQFSLVQQLQRAAVSIPANISEGYNRQTRKEYLQFLHIALGSLAELETHILIATAQSYIEQKKSQELLDETMQIGKMLRTIIKKLKAPAT
ncbi:MAG: four helix bundle protein [Alphaproteobacteria bacterium]|nr:four helix bundle protein [Alphaproteobacteria bacterium]